jgi:hypothetical protein
MKSISDAIEFVNQQIEYQDRRATITRAEPNKLKFHVDNANQFRSLLKFIEENTPTSNPPLPIQNTTPPDIDPTGALMPKELSGLPPELLGELSGGGIDKQELLIIELIESAGGTLSLDRLLIGIYKRTGEIMKRALLTAKLYRMSQNGMIFRVQKKKGIYTTDPFKGTTSQEDEE